MKNKISLIIIVLLVFGCRKSEISIHNPINGIDIYIAGNKSTANNTPFIMKNGEVRLIEFGNLTGNKITLKDFTMSNGKEYASFSFSEPSVNLSRGAYTVDQQVHYLTPALSESNDKIFVENNQVYTAGNNYQEENIIVNVLKNGSLFQSYNTENIGSFKNLFVTGSDVFLSFFNNIYYYKNGIVDSISHKGQNTQVNDLFVKGNNVYMCGFYLQETGNNVKTIGTYWINGNLYELPTTNLYQFANKIKVDKNDIYVLYSEIETGTSAKNIKYLKNGQAYTIPKTEELGVAHDMQIHEGDVYTLITIFENSNLTAQVFKNTKLIASYPIHDFSYYENLKLQIDKKRK